MKIFLNPESGLRGEKFAIILDVVFNDRRKKYIQLIEISNRLSFRKTKAGRLRFDSLVSTLSKIRCVDLYLDLDVLLPEQEELPSARSAKKDFPNYWTVRLRICDWLEQLYNRFYELLQV